MSHYATFGKGTPRHLNSDHDSLHRYHQRRVNLRIHEVQTIQTAPIVPLAHPFTERRIGTIRGECLDQILFWNVRDSNKNPEGFKDYWNAYWLHQSLDLKTPDEVAYPNGFKKAFMKGVLRRPLSDTHRRMIKNLPPTELINNHRFQDKPPIRRTP